MEYQENTKETLTTGASFNAIINAMDSFKILAMKYMKDEGLDGYVGDMQHWYPFQPFLNVLRRIKEKVGPNTLYGVGKKIIDHQLFSPELSGEKEGIVSIDEAFPYVNSIFHRNHKTSEGEIYYDEKREGSPFIEGLGAYTYEKVDENSCIVRCDTPFPEEFDHGMVVNVSIYYYPNSTVAHMDERECKKKGGNSCSFLVKW